MEPFVIATGTMDYAQNTFIRVLKRSSQLWLTSRFIRIMMLNEFVKQMLVITSISSFSKSGGIREALRINKVAAEYGINCMIGGMLESRLGLAAKVHFAYAAPNVKFFDLDTCLVDHLKDSVVGGIQYDGYKIYISSSRGC